MKQITHRLMILLFMFMITCQASAQTKLFGNIQRSAGVEYFFTSSINKNNPNLSKRVPKIKGIDTEYLVSHIYNIEMISATRPEKGEDRTDQVKDTVNSIIEKLEFETMYQIIEDEQELTVYSKPNRWGGAQIIITQMLRSEPPRYLAVIYNCSNFNIDDLFIKEEKE